MPSPCSERHGEDLSGRVKTGSLGQVTKKKKENNEKKMGITRPRPDGGVTTDLVNEFISNFVVFYFY